MGREIDKTARGGASGGIPAATLRWVARIASVAAIGLFLAFLFGEGLPPLTLQALCFPYGVLVGLILAWRFERAGGLLAVTGFLMFYVLEYLSAGSLPKGYAFLLLSSPGALFVCSGFLRARRRCVGSGIP